MELQEAQKLLANLKAINLKIGDETTGQIKQLNDANDRLDKIKNIKENIDLISNNIKAIQNQKQTSFYISIVVSLLLGLLLGSLYIAKPTIVALSDQYEKYEIDRKTDFEKKVSNIKKEYEKKVSELKLSSEDTLLLQTEDLSDTIAKKDDEIRKLKQKIKKIGSTNSTASKLNKLGVRISLYKSKGDDFHKLTIDPSSVNNIISNSNNSLLFKAE